MEVQDTIRKFRELNQLTQEDMAEKLDISVNGYSKLERGISKISLEKLEQIANIFNINVSELYSAKEKGFFCLFNEISGINQNNSTYYADAESVNVENEKLRLQLEYKDELLNQKNVLIQEKENEIQTLKEMVKCLNDMNQMLKKETSSK